MNIFRKLHRLCSGMVWSVVGWYVDTYREGRDFFRWFFDLEELNQSGYPTTLAEHSPPAPRTSLVLREGRQSEARDIRRLELMLFSKPWSLRRIRRIWDHPRRHTCVVAVLDEEVLGYVVGYFTGSRLKITRVGVDLRFQGEGFGRAMMRGIGSMYCEVCEYVYADTYKYSDEAYEFFCRLGFTPVQVGEKQQFRLSCQDSLFNLNLPFK